jgi:peptide/nickel transport system substrate-binding protein
MEKTTDRWWDKLGTPQYGGEMTIASRNIENFDPYFNEGLTTIQSAWMERLIADDWAVNPEEWNYRIHFRPDEYLKGHLAENWEFPDSNTLIVRLRQGIHWQDVPPVNEREFTADDVAYHYHRLFGLGSGFSQPAAAHANVVTAYRNLVSVSAEDKYTVIFKWTTIARESMKETLQAPTNAGCIEAREAVEKWGDVNDWRHAVGTGPFVLKNFIPRESATLDKNPRYWGHDERYPQNQLPYVDKLTFLIIPDENEALEALHSGKIDILERVTFQQAQIMKVRNPEIIQIPGPASNAETIDPRNDRPPFNDIRVRKAMQMAIDLPMIAKSYYGGTVDPYPCALTSRYMKGWGFPYEEWPHSLKEEYTYNPGAAKKLLAEAGYPDGFNTNIVADSAGDMGLLQIVKFYFARVGINMEIRPVKTETWMSDIKTGHKHDQLAHRTGQGQLGHCMEPIRQLNPLVRGYPTNYLMLNDAVLDDFYTKALTADSTDEMKQVIREANEYYTRQHFTISLLHPRRYFLHQPWLKGYNAQYYSVSAVTGGPTLLFFYPARFWIDQKIKKAMGY